jgi:Outer membrane lipoprotein-sorting protein
VANSELNTRLPLKAWFIVLALCCGFARAQNPQQTGALQQNQQLSSILEKMQQARSQAWSSAPYQLIREYRLFGEDESHPSSEVTAEIDYLPPAEKSYLIQNRVGSSRGEEVVRKILQHETEVSGEKQRSEGAIDSANYSFQYLGETTRDGHLCYVLGLNPKRKDTELIRGTAWVDAHSFLVRHIEGQMVKNPSWMLKRVDVTLDFTAVGGAWVQSGMTAVADVRFIGRQTLKAETVQTQVGESLARNTGANFNLRKRHRSRMPAAVLVPLPSNH